MIQEVLVEHWKSFEKATLYLDPLTLLIGPNASGKSNLVEALVFLQRLGAGADLDDAVNGSTVLPGLRGGSATICRRPSPWFAVEVVVGAPGRADCRYRVKVWADELSVTAFEEELAIRGGEFENGADGERRLFWTERQGTEAELKPKITRHPVMGEVTEHAHVRGQGVDTHWLTRGGSVRTTLGAGISSSGLTRLPPFEFDDYVLEAVARVRSSLERIFVLAPVVQGMRAAAALSERLKPDGSNVAGVLAGLAPGRKAEAESILTRYLKQIPERDIQRVWSQRVGVLGNDAILYCEEGWPAAGGRTIDAKTMSDGTLRFIALATAMVVLPAGTLLVVEDVDDGLHPSRATTLLDMLRQLGKERDIDVLVTTHNPAVLDAGGVRLLPFITFCHRDDHTGASKLTLLEDIEQLPKLLAAGTIGQLETAGRIRSALAEGA